MKKFTLIILLFSVYYSSAQGYKITLHTPGYKSGVAYLTYHMGKNLNVQDSAIFKNGLAVFSGKQTLPGGIYAIVFPGKRLTTEFLVDKEQQITVKADTIKK